VPPATSTQITQLLARWSDGDHSAREALIPLIYDELRRVARNALSGQRPGHTLGNTAPVHEAYVRLVGPDKVVRAIGFRCHSYRTNCILSRWML